MSTTSNAMNIKDTSKLTGLSPSVLRIWELRYGWPCPKRKPNGYRSYQQHQVDELKRIAQLVKEGAPISTLIVDGLPRWPTAGACRAATRTLPKTRSMPAPQDPAEALLHRDLLEAFENHRSPMIRQLLQRIFWTVKPSDEPQTALAPAIVAMAELRSLGRPLQESAEIVSMIKERCVQLLRMQRIPQDALLVVPARAGDEALAALTAVILCFRGIPAKPWTELREPTSACLVVNDGETLPATRNHQVACVSMLGSEGSLSLTSLLDRSKPLPWTTVVASN